MVQSVNTKVDFVADATSYMGLTDYGKVMIGDKAFEFYNARNAQKYIRIPWNEVDYVIASVMFQGKWIPRYALRTKKNGTYTFSSKHPKDVLRAIRNYVESERMVKSLTFFQVVKRGLKAMFVRKRSQ
ncbi:DUF956 family protein [Sporolactobacillus terrae]|uniref:DUF956 domain-containing protein n=1 Tax=Sporolactobacillus terrae TaxID=269673 RepID=A0A410DAK2_9BACL|nr:DUF956 family protein [Sporolactobacillus terrae]QAA23115.1 DUF956 domain-containing protein [Sporolactobacillus terrae]QAA26086.1 DUF956 domain-containing protein [Sporolactobacillus terrae]UAK15180.1 DUF956 family protein [Sporolactobacillus terrae]BBN99529.1 DUF956 domain-containing protein [Sporolactobacillus terrae]